MNICRNQLKSKKNNQGHQEFIKTCKLKKKIFNNIKI